MPNKVPSVTKGLSITMKAAAALEALRLVKISADDTFADAGANEYAIGFTLKEAKAANDLIAVELFRFTKKVKMITSGALAAGEWVKLAAANGAVQRVAKFVPGVDAEERKIGLCLIGGADAAEVTFLA